MDEKHIIDEMGRAIKGLHYGKSTSWDTISAEVWKHGKINLSNKLHRWITIIWEEGHVPHEYKEACIGDRTECGNYRGILLLSAADKTFVRILPNRLSSHCTQEMVPETQCDFRSNHNTVDMTFFCDNSRKSAYSKIELSILSLLNL